MSLEDQKCTPCRGDVPPMERHAAEALLRKLGGEWQLNADSHLERTYKFKNFRQAMSLANKVADIAEAEGHHPDIYIAWGQCRVEVWTHKIKGLTESDFFFAAKADRAFMSLST